MANPLQIANKSKLIEEKSQFLLQDLLKQYNQGDIKTTTELQYRLYVALEDLYTQFGKPTMQKRLAWGAPMSDDYNTMMLEIYSDLRTLFSESKNMSKAVQESFEQVELERQTMNWQMSDLRDRLKGVSLKMEQKRGEIIFRDSFMDAKHFDKTMIETEAATINTNEGVLSLTRLDAQEYREGVSLRILEGNGFAGNTHQVRALDGAYKFFGEDNMHLDLVALMDGNSDTWFEYEAFNISDETRIQTNDYGFSYKEGFKWVRETTEGLRLHIEVELPIAKTVNWFSLSPFLPSDKGATPCVVRSVIVHDGKGAANEVSSGYDVLQEDKVFIFPRQKCKRITVQLEQQTAYETLIGHFFFKELEEKSVNFLAKDKEQRGRRIDGPKPSIENLFYKYDPSTRELHLPKRINDGTGLSDSMVAKGELFSIPKTEGQVQAGLEALNARRYMIGLRELSISSYRFAAESAYISESFSSPEEITSISLDAESIVPSEFGDGEWVRYFISIDEGRNWKEVSTRGTSKSGAKVAYMINGNIPIEGRFDNYGYIDTLQPVHNVRLKIVLSRPTEIKDADYYTPLIKEYKLRCKTVKGEL